MAAIPLMMKKWSPLFDAQREFIDKESIWARLPMFPSIYWNHKRFMAIGNCLGEFMAADMNFEATGQMTVERILVHMEFKKGFPPDIGVVTPKGRLIKLLDYEGIPFRCHKCHHYGHMVDSCPMAPRIFLVDVLEGDGIPHMCGVSDMDPVISGR